MSPARPRWASADEAPHLAAFAALAYGIAPEYFLRRWAADPGPSSASCVLEDERVTVAHLRVVDRALNLGTTALRCAVIANVATHPAARGRGHAGRLLDWALAELSAAGVPVALLHTHVPDLYARSGFVELPQTDAVLRDGGGEVPREGPPPSAHERALYSAEHGRRPGTLVRDHRYWTVRDTWLLPEGWRVVRFADLDGYAYVRPRDGGVEVGEAVADCARRLLRGAPGTGWRWRLPAAVDDGLRRVADRSAVAMTRALGSGVDLAALWSPQAVCWPTDGS